ncbi:protein of unknown function (DU1801) [Sphaerochaeta associata]|uniref:DUF1801 domain-containing protein n=1 Tax=Sphaerochaeta associata TaxID=1129264 RepID=A0ABY4DDA5_9SPIR|nr:DUF1801 domain-containing protein [Sphaerochaeta associata]UOM52234.1 DUF1801 domain-containing protein [Sphaerochaeta associata]SMP46060.1 protein of unknown function (DU1801) [Sphaerochaeta associata]
MTTNATTVLDYLATLTDEQRSIIVPVRSVILSHLPSGFVETINWGMLSYEVPLEIYPNTYNKKPLSYVGLAVQKQYYSLYLMPAYMDQNVYQTLMDAFEKAGKKLSMGKSCIRFKKVEDLPLDLIGSIIASHSVKSFITAYETARKA